MPSALSTYTPTPTVSIGGSSATDFVELILAVTVEESVDGLTRCEVRLDNWGVVDGGPGYVVAQRGLLDFGASLEVAFGPPDEHETVFNGRVTALEAEYGGATGPSIVVLAEDALQDLRMTRRTRTFEESSDEDIVAVIAADHALTPDVELPGPTHDVVCQLNQSDLAFLRDRALPYGADVWLDGTTLHAGRRDDEPVVLRFGQELLAFRVLADLAMQATEQYVAGWDPLTKEAVLESSDESSLGTDIGSGIGGGTLLSSKFGDRPAVATLPYAVTTAEARALADGLYRQRARRFVTGSGTTDGLAALRAGRSVELAGLGGLFDGQYRMARVVHRYDLDSGYRTEIDVERSELPR